MSMALAELVSERLKETGHTRKWLADEIGVSPQTITNLLSGIRPDIATLEKLSRFLEEPMTKLLQLLGVLPTEHAEEEELVRILGDDWRLMEMVTLMKGMNAEEKQKLLEVARLFPKSKT